MIASLKKFKPKQPRGLIVFQACDIVNVTLKTEVQLDLRCVCFFRPLIQLSKPSAALLYVLLPLPHFQGACSSPLSVEEFRLASSVTLIKWKTETPHPSPPASTLQCSTICRWKSASTAPCSARRKEWTALLKATHPLMVIKKGQRPHSERL